MKELWIKQCAGWNQRGPCYARRASGPTEEVKVVQPQNNSPVDCEYRSEVKRRAVAAAPRCAYYILSAPLLESACRHQASTLLPRSHSQAGIHWILTSSLPIWLNTGGRHCPFSSFPLWQDLCFFLLSSCINLEMPPAKSGRKMVVWTNKDAFFLRIHECQARQSGDAPTVWQGH